MKRHISLLRLHAVSVSFNALYLYNHVNNGLKEAGLDVKAEDIVDVIEGYKGEGHKANTLEELGKQPIYIV